MDYNNNSTENNSWGSGIRFKEEKKPKRLLKVLGIVMIVFFSASIGGILGGYYVKTNYTPSYQGHDTGSNETNQSSSVKVSNLPKNTITQVAEKVGPAVVGISNNVLTPFSGLKPAGSGSGIIIDREGYIITNNHVIKGATSVTVTLPGGKKVPARIIGGDDQADLAVLKINMANLPVAKLGDSSEIRVGDVAVAIGNPLGEEFAGTVTAGIVSGINRELDTDKGTYRYIQTDASINPGNSGGALCNADGEVIGINSVKISDRFENVEGMGFAIPISDAKPIIDEIIKKGYVSRPQIGIRYEDIDSDTAQAYGVPVGAGVHEVAQGGPAYQAGIVSGDIIVEIDGVKLNDDTNLRIIINRRKIGDVIPIRVWRDGKYLDFKVKLGDSVNFR